MISPSRPVYIPYVPDNGALASKDKLSVVLAGEDVNHELQLRRELREWTLVVQHPNLNNVTEVFSFSYKPLVPYRSTNDTGMFYGIKFFNDQLMEAGPLGNVQSEVLLQKDAFTFTLNQGWAFPQKVYFKGDECMMPPPDSYPYFLSSSPKNSVPAMAVAATILWSLILNSII